MDEEKRTRLERWIAYEAVAADVQLGDMVKLAGGAIQENWLVPATVDGGYHDGTGHQWVVRTDAPSGVTTSHSRAQEFALMREASDAGVCVPWPRFLCEDPSVIGAPFLIVDYAEGSANGRQLVREPEISQFGPKLAERLGQELATIHTIRPPCEELSFLPMPETNYGRHRVETYRNYLDEIGEPQPALEWILRWLERNAPETKELVLCHADYRTGNYLVHQGELTAILDWEFAGWGDPMEDIGWFSAKCWRFGAWDREAGGIAARADFYRGYNQVSDIKIDQAIIPYWEVMAAARWAVIALQQGHRYTSRKERTLELALTGRMVPEMEMDALMLIKQIEAEGGYA